MHLVSEDSQGEKAADEASCGVGAEDSANQLG